ncbi:MAG: RTX toxin [Acidobacteriota bacterium]
MRAVLLLSILMPLGAAGAEETPSSGLAAPASINLGVGGFWKPVGAAPAFFGQSENLEDDDPVSGAIHTVAAHPTNAKVLYAGAVNGGIWRTLNADSPTPSWRRLTDDQNSNSIGALEFDPTDPVHLTLVAGIGSWSNFANSGGRATGLLRTTNAGITWTPIEGGGVLIDKNVSGVAVRGSTIVVAVDRSAQFTFATIGIFRSTNGGATFTQISNGNGSATGLPGGPSYDLVGDPLRPNRLFTNVDFANILGGVNGIYRSDDTGATWTRVSSPAMNTLLTGNIFNVELAVGRHNNVYCAMVDDTMIAGALFAVFRSGDGGTTWTRMDLPSTPDGGIHPGHQGFNNLSIVADPTNANLVYIGGDRQPYRNEPLGGPIQWPNSIGANNFTGRLFRGDASKPAGGQWVHLTHSKTLGAPGGGTAHNTAPHADSREMVFDAAGNLIETDDGGIYKRTRPQNNTGDWFSMVGDMQVGEYHDAAFDANSETLTAGSQDNGFQYQLAADDDDWSLLLQGDGGDVATDDTTIPGVSIRYGSMQNFERFVRTFWDADNNFLAFDEPAHTPLGGGAPVVGSPVTPVELNGVDPTRLVIAAANSFYESFDQGDTVTEIAPGLGVNHIQGRVPLAPVAYGAGTNVAALYVGSDDRLYVRTAPHPAPLLQSLAFPGTGSGRSLVDIALDPDNASAVFVADVGRVFTSRNAGSSWNDITGNLTALGAGRLQTLVYLKTRLGDGLVVGSQTGAWIASKLTGFSQWYPLGKGLPTVPVFDLDYDIGADRLIAATLGRAAWTLDQVKVAVLLAR